MYIGADADSDRYLLYVKFNIRISVKRKMTPRKPRLGTMYKS